MVKKAKFVTTYLPTSGQGSEVKTAAVQVICIFNLDASKKQTALASPSCTETSKKVNLNGNL